MPDLQKSEREEFQSLISVSHETSAKLTRYAELLREWNSKFNLVAESTLDHIWQRHFLDSAQLAKNIPETANTIADLGSGAGFPGLVLSILGTGEMHLIESTGKKCDFLRAVIDDLKLGAIVHQSRVEDMKTQFDVITARALKPLPELLKLSKPLMHKDSICVFLKGEKCDVELTAAAKYWRFDHETFPSLSGPSGRVLKLSRLSSSGRMPKT